MTTKMPTTPRTPLSAQRYGRLLHNTTICTQTEMSKRCPVRAPICRLMPKSTPKMASRIQHPPVMSTSKVRMINFFKKAKSKLSFVYNPAVEIDYLAQTFAMIQILGCGSFGVVVEMEAKEDGRKYAVKYQLPYKSHFNRFQQLREVVFLQFINHPNCVRFYAAWEEADRLHIQTELCECNLQKFMSNFDGQVPEPRVWLVLLDLLRALAYLHSHSIVHLDVKPENILLDAHEIAKLSDFGMAFDLQSDNADECRIEGDSRYLALEALNDDANRVTTKRDIYSLGVTVLQLATDLFIPTYGDELHDIRAFNLPQSLIRRMSVELRSIVAKMMSLDFRARPEAREILEMDEVVEREFGRRQFVQTHSSHWNESEDFVEPGARNSIKTTLKFLQQEYQDYLKHSSCQPLQHPIPALETPQRLQFSPRIKRPHE